MQPGSQVVGRLAPTPSGELHLGNVLAFAAAYLSARSQGGRLLLRMEDVDRGRARDAIAESQRDDLRWLGLHWDEEVPPQSARAYPLDGIPTYRCGCNRTSRLLGRCGCRHAPTANGAELSNGSVWKFNAPIGPVEFIDRARGLVHAEPGDDPILWRADCSAGYPLAVVLDDERDGVTEVVRGADLLHATAHQVQLRELLGFRHCTWLHVPVLYGSDGKKLSKSEGAAGIRNLRAAGWSPQDVWRLLEPVLGPFDVDRFDVGRFDPATFPGGPASVFVVADGPRIVVQQAT